MFKAELIVQEDIFNAIQETAQKAPGLMKTLTKRRFTRVKRKYLVRLRAEPPPLNETNYPLRWKSERQRRYVMMILTEANNLPYQRTHDLVNAWEMNLSLDANGATIEAKNDDPAAQYVQGDWAQMFHLDNGWPQAAPILVEMESELNDGLINDWFVAIDPVGAVSG